MTATALFLGLCGLAATFLPQEILGFAGVAATGNAPLFVQWLGALLLGFAMLNWMAKDSLIGGIYNRPVAIGNLVHFLIVAIAIAKLLFAGNAQPFVLILGAFYIVFALGFAWLVFAGSPVKPAA